MKSAAWSTNDTLEREVSQHAWKKQRQILIRVAAWPWQGCTGGPSGFSPTECMRLPKSHLCQSWHRSLKVLTRFCYKRKLNSGISWDNLSCFLHSWTALGVHYRIFTETPPRLWSTINTIDCCLASDPCLESIEGRNTWWENAVIKSLSFVSIVKRNWSGSSKDFPILVFWSPCCR